MGLNNDVSLLYDKVKSGNLQYSDFVDEIAKLIQPSGDQLKEALFNITPAIPSWLKNLDFELFAKELNK